MRSKAICLVLLAAVAALLVLREIQLSRGLAALREEKTNLQTQQESTDARLAQAEEKLQSFLNPQPISTLPVQLPANRDAQARIIALETQVQALSNIVARQNPARAVPGSWSQSPGFLPDAPPSYDAVDAVQTNATDRAWGPEQVLGPPNTAQAGDIPTAWASRDPDAGPEWLSVGFERATQLAEVRIRETFNPGAIVKVSAYVNAQEVVLWEGKESSGVAPRDFVVPVTQNISSQQIVVFLDTTLVQGWNEIDAVELVGRDGTRQWAASASASSTYAERPTVPPEIDLIR